MLCALVEVPEARYSPDVTLCKILEGSAELGHLRAFTSRSPAYFMDSSRSGYMKNIVVYKVSAPT